jgi:hypothetical protein
MLEKYYNKISKYNWTTETDFYENIDLFIEDNIKTLKNINEDYFQKFYNKNEIDYFVKHHLKYDPFHWDRGNDFLSSCPVFNIYNDENNNQDNIIEIINLLYQNILLSKKTIKIMLPSIIEFKHFEVLKILLDTPYAEYILNKINDKSLEIKKFIIESNTCIK